MLLLMLLNGEGRGVRFEVSGRVPVFIGRHALGLDKPDSRMSRQHAEVWQENGIWLLRDLNSTNGTFVNGKRLKGKLCELEVGDHLRCGRTEFVVADIRGGASPVPGAPAVLDETKIVDAEDVSPQLSQKSPHASASAVALGEVRLNDGSDAAARSGVHGAPSAAEPDDHPDADRVSLRDDDAARHDRALIPPGRSRPVPVILEEDDEDADEPAEAVSSVGEDAGASAEQAAGVIDPELEADEREDNVPPSEAEVDLAIEPEEPEPVDNAVASEEPDSAAAVMDALPQAVAEAVTETPTVEPEIAEAESAGDEPVAELEDEPETEIDAAGREVAVTELAADDVVSNVDADAEVESADGVGLSTEDEPSDQYDAEEVVSSPADHEPALSAEPEDDDVLAIDADLDPEAEAVAEAPAAADDSGATLIPDASADEADEYAAEPAVFGLSLRHAAPLEPDQRDEDPEPTAEATPVEVEGVEAAADVVDTVPDAAVDAEEDSSAAAEVSDNSVDDEEPAPSADSDRVSADDEDDDELLKLGFKGDDRFSPDLAEADDAELRGDAPRLPTESGRFVITDEDDAVAFDEPGAELADSSLAGVIVDDEVDTAEAETPNPAAGFSTETHSEEEDAAAHAARWAEPSRSRGPSGRGRQSLPLAIVGVVVVALVGAAWLFAASRMGWLTAPQIAGKDTATDTENTAVAADSTTTAADESLALATPPAADTAPPTGNPGQRQPSVFVDLPPADTPAPTVRASDTPAPITDAGTDADNTGPSETPAPPTVAVEPNPDTPVVIDPADLVDANAASTTDTPSAVEPGLSLPAPSTDTADAAPASNAGPRIATAEELQDIIRGGSPGVATGDTETDATVNSGDDADTVTVADADTGLAPADPREALAWAGLKVNDPDSVFTRPVNPGAPTDEEVLTDAVDADADPTIPDPVAPTILDADALPPTTANADGPATPAAAVTGDVVYLVDISGTMIDSMPVLRQYLRDQIDRLAPEQSFSVILFRQGEATELPPLGLRPATAVEKSDARDWLAADAQNIRLGGRSDPTDALATALNYGVADVVILSDNALGRRAKSGGADLNLRDLTAVLDDHPGVTVHAVQFFYPDDRRLLERLARRFGGAFEFVEEVTDANRNAAPSSPSLIGGLSALP